MQTKKRKRRRKYIPKKAREKIKQKKIAKERIEILKNLIKRDSKGEWANRYKELIKKISKKYRIRPKTKVFKH